MIEIYINQIIVIKDKTYRANKGKLLYTFYGDGYNESEKESYEVSKEVLEEYIQYCEDQIKFAKKYMKGLKEC